MPGEALFALVVIADARLFLCTVVGRHLGIEKSSVPTGSHFDAVELMSEGSLACIH